jgi:hypothetical protein
MFAYCTNLKKVEAKYFDLSGANVSTAITTTGLYNIFYYCENLEEIEDIGMPAGGYHQTFRVCRNLKKIHKLRVNENCGFSSAFNSCTSLEEISEIEGSIGQNGLDLSWSPLNRATIERILSSLNESGGVVTFRKSAVDAAFETSEGANDGSESEDWLDWIRLKEDNGWSIALGENGKVEQEEKV